MFVPVVMAEAIDCALAKKSASTTAPLFTVGTSYRPTSPAPLVIASHSRMTSDTRAPDGMRAKR